VKKERAKKLRELGARKKKSFARSFVGRRLGVLLESRAKNGALTGYSRNYLTVAANGGRVNDEVEVAVESFEDGALVGTVADFA
jgi:tRNA A37 methylthiotransferase MiaB